MYSKRRASWVKHADFMILDILCMAIALYIGYTERHGFDSVSMSRGRIYWRLLAVLVIVDICVMFFNESYKSIVRRGYLTEVKDTTKHCFTVDAVLLLYLFVVQQSGLYSRETMLVYVVLQVVFTYLVRCFRKHWIRVKMLNNPYVEKMLILTDREHAQQCAADLAKDQYRNFQVVGMILRDVETLDNNVQQTEDSSDDIGEMPEDELCYAATQEEIEGIPVVAGYYQIYDYLLNNVVDSVFIYADMTNKEVQHMSNRLVRAGLTVHVNLIRMEEEFTNQTIEHIGKYTVLTSGMHLATERQIFLKRCMDVAGGLVGTLLTGLIAVIIGPIIYIQSPGPIFFKQERVGKNGRTFQIYKFRSMYMDAEERKKELMDQNEMEDSRMFKIKDDPRIIPIGHFIRKFSIDEFPQFLNVLRGDMSLVGTRPPTLEEFNQYLIYHKGRLSSKPGITGLWQISGRSDITDFEEVVALDVEYITHWSLGLDVKILWKTVVKVISAEGAS